MPCPMRDDMKARHLKFTREISSPPGNMLQMKICKEDILPKVAALPLFGNCTRKELTDILTESRGVVREFDAGEVVLHECMPAVSMMVVVSGVVFVQECGLADGTRHLVQRLYAGGTFGATFVSLAPEKSPGMLIAEEPSAVLALDVSCLRRMMEAGRHPGFLANLYKAVCVQGFYAWRKLMLLNCYEIADRVLLYLKWRRDDGLTAPAKFKCSELAEYLGVNRTALHRAIAKLRRSGRIVARDDTIAARG